MATISPPPATRADARRDVDAHPRVVVAAAVGVGGVQPDADRRGEAGVVAVVPQRALDRDRAVDRRAGGVEGGEEAVAGRVDDLPSPGRDDAPERVVVPAQEPLPRGVAERLREHRRADDVGEHERPAHVRRAGPPLLGGPQLALGRRGIDHRPEPLELLERGPQLEVRVIVVVEQREAPSRAAPGRGRPRTATRPRASP